MSLYEVVVCTLLFLMGGLATYLVQARQKWSFPFSVLFFGPGLLLAQVCSFIVSKPGGTFWGRIWATDQPVFYGFPITYYFVSAWARPKFVISFILFTFTITAVMGLLCMPENRCPSSVKQDLSKTVLVMNGLFLAFSLMIGITNATYFVLSWSVNHSVRGVIEHTVFGEFLWSLVLAGGNALLYRVVRTQGRLAAAYLFFQLLLLEPFLRLGVAFNRFITVLIVLSALAVIVNLIWQAVPKLKPFYS